LNGVKHTASTSPAFRHEERPTEVLKRVAAAFCRCFADAHAARRQARLIKQHRTRARFRTCILRHNLDVERDTGHLCAFFKDAAIRDYDDAPGLA